MGLSLVPFLSWQIQNLSKTVELGYILCGSKPALVSGCDDDAQISGEHEEKGAEECFLKSVAVLSQQAGGYI